MPSRRTASSAFPALLAGLVLSSCGPQFDPPSTVDSLRVLAVQKDIPYAAPGDTVRLKMLWSDGSEEASSTRPIQIGWIGGCINPLGDLYAGCFGPGQFQPDPVTGMPPFGTGDEFSFTLPDTIISDRPPPPDPRQPPYGLSYVFFAICAGQLDTQLDFTGLPIRCLDSNGNPLGSTDFVAGYTAIYVYDDFRNGNPIVRGLSIDGKPLLDGCVDPASAAAANGDELGALLGRAGETTRQSQGLSVCDSAALVDPADAPDCTAPDAPCLSAPVDGSHLVLPVKIRPEVYRASIEPDAISKQAYGRDYEEQMWINYYTTGGTLRTDVRLLNDATTGLNDEFHTQYWPTLEPGPVTLWAVVHDNRGGVGWARGTIWIR